jgi:hypothetical protein
MALRGLVVVGFAGGISLLSGSAAHAADPHGTGAPDSTGPVANLITGPGGHGIDDILEIGSSRPVTWLLTPSDATSIARTDGAPVITRQADATTQVADRLGSGHGPVQPERAPLTEYPGLGLPTGTSTGGSVSHHPGAVAVAVAPSAVAGIPEASRRMLSADQVGVLRLVAEAPTVSPD